jgi:flavin reductase (DIM6/NTAB) family NADH-FMN oxidoreductase RutF/rubredoxin
MIDTKAFRSLSYGLYIVSAQDGDKTAGCVVNTFAQVTSTPPRVSVAINKENHTSQAIQEAGTFSVVSLAQSASMELIGLFGFQSSRDIDKFATTNSACDVHGTPFVAEQAVARFAVKVLHTLDVGTHLLFVGDVIEAEVLSPEPPLTYAHYHQVKGGKTPPKASSYEPNDDAEKSATSTPAPSPKTAWRCRICGHIVELEELPEDFICPICKKDKTYFDRITL